MLSSRVADMKLNVGLALLALAVMMAGCGSGPPPRLYLLEPVSDEALGLEVPAIAAIGLGKVSLPAYADDERVATRIEGGQVQINDRERWAERPADALPRLLADRLGSLTAATVLAEPWPRGFDPDYRIEVIFDKLLRESNGGVEMAGHINIITGDGRRVLRVIPFQQTQLAQSSDFAAFFESVATGINELTRKVSATLSELQLDA